jgi:hypothetical protein
MNYDEIGIKLNVVKESLVGWVLVKNIAFYFLPFFKFSSLLLF